MAKKKPARRPAARPTRPARRSARRPARRHPLAPVSLPAPRGDTHIVIEDEPVSFLTLESLEPGKVHIRPRSIEAVSHPVQRSGGDSDGRGGFQLYVTLASGQKTIILDTAANRVTLGIPQAEARGATATQLVGSRPPRAARTKPVPSATIPPSSAADSEPIAHDEDDEG